MSHPARIGGYKPRGSGRVGSYGPALIPLCLIFIPVLIRLSLDFLEPETIRDFSAGLSSAQNWRIYGFSLGQAALSALLAVLLGFPAAFMSSRWAFPGKRFLRSIFSIPFVLPALLLALGLSGFLGKAGILNRFLSLFGIPSLNFIYGLRGILIAHVIFNFPLAARLIGSALAQAHPGSEEAAALLGAGKVRVFFTIILPEALPGILSAFFLSFLYCFQSFSIVLIFGGGPRFTTLELGIYQAMRLSFQAGDAAALALLELMTGLILAFLYAHFSRGRPLMASLRPKLLHKAGGWQKGFGILYLGLAAFLILGPLISIIIQAFSAPSLRARFGSPSLLNFINLFSTSSAASSWKALGTSILLGLCSASLALCLALIANAGPMRRRGPSYAIILSILPLAISPLILSRALKPVLGFLPSFISLCIFHAALALPLASQSIYAGLAKLPGSLEEAALSLGASPLRAWWEIRLPLLKQSIMSAFLFSFCISVGDLSGPLSLAQDGIQPLSLLIARLAGAYRFPQASALGLILLIMTGLAFALVEDA